MQKATSSFKVPQNNNSSLPDWTFSSKPKFHQYPTWLISLSVNLVQDIQLSPRKCKKVLASILPYLAPHTRVPSAGSIRIWSKKLAHFVLHSKSDVDEDTQWAFIIDESISLGSQKLLVIIGVPLYLSLERPLRHQDVRVLSIKVSGSWKGEGISKQISEVIARGYPCQYIISDKGPNLVFAAKLSKLPRVADCSHEVANVLSREYTGSDRYENFVAACTAMKRKGVISKYAHLLPPQLRHHSRFMNISVVIEWARKTLLIYDLDLNDDQIKPFRDRIAWLSDHRQFIEEMTGVFTVVNPFLKLLKKQGLSNHTVQTCERLLEKGKLPEVISIELLNYLKTNRSKALGIDRPAIHCCSDLLETYFGKYKNNAGKRITATCLYMVGYGKRFERLQVSQAMSSATVKVVSKWLRSSFGNSSLSKRKKVYALF
jgi:hypothetical protein